MVDYLSTSFFLSYPAVPGAETNTIHHFLPLPPHQVLVKPQMVPRGVDFEKQRQRKCPLASDTILSRREHQQIYRVPQEPPGD